MEFIGKGRGLVVVLMHPIGHEVEVTQQLLAANSLLIAQAIIYPILCVQLALSAVIISILKEYSCEVLAQESADFTQGPQMSSCKHF